ncbi:uncharacterized protein LOC130731635 [Lotus japonicus]|uniref:uncharacterized protein LOC130731635 n=1 Tax=Lotus japonicus TaxID=34305 RepID=UPI002588D68D|nr:uncharacterized protein LOC130731635 [Lotus japonicus]
MIESSVARISAYAAEMRIKTALEAEQYIGTAKEAEYEEICKPEECLDLDHFNEDRSEPVLDCIYDDEPLGFEQSLDPMLKMQAQDPLQEVDLGDGTKKRPTYVSSLIDSGFKNRIVSLLQEYKDCFAWDYDEMPGLSRELVELKLPIRPGRKPVKQAPRRFAPEVFSKIKEEVERLLGAKFIRTARG